MKALWNGTMLANSDNTIEVDGNEYFPPEGVRCDLLVASVSHTTCHWKGVANYYHVLVDGKINRDAAWYYPDPPNPAFTQIKGWIAFGKDIRIAA